MPDSTPTLSGPGARGPAVPPRYRVTEELGRGGMGIVYRAEDRELERLVALKLLRPELAEDERARARFLREARAIAALDHPNLCTIHEVGETRDGIPYFAMAYYDGRSLAARLAEGPVPVDESLEIVVQIARGLARAHEAGVIHRDLKPDNVLLTRHGEVRIVDFGLARRDRGETITLEGAILGTAAYMSPEQARGERADHRADIWALGVVLFEMLAGRRPFEGPSFAALLHQITRSAPPAVTTERPDLPTGLARIVTRAMAREPEKRYPSVGEMLEDLERVRPFAGPAAVRAGGGSRSTSVAVLPFANVSADPEQEYFCDGMTEEIINALARVAGLRVIARTSAFAFKDRSEDVREIARQLDVGRLLEGSVRRIGDRIRVTAHLVDAEDGSQLWSDRYDRTLEDVFAVQDEISLAIVEHLRGTLLTGPEEVPSRKPPTDLAAYELYLRGLHEWNRLSPTGFERSAELFRRSMEADARFAPPVVGLAIWFNSQSYWGRLPPSVSFGQAEELTRRALELDPRSSLAYNVLAACEGFFHYRWEDAERSFLRAIELGPGQAINHANYGTFLVLRGRPEEAIRESKIALGLDPLSSVIAGFTGINRGLAGDLDDALADLERAAAADATAWLLQYSLGSVRIARHEFAGAARNAEKAVELSGGHAPTLMLAACAAYLENDRERGDTHSQALAALARVDYVPPMFLTWVELARGELAAASDRALEALAQRDPWLLFHPHLAWHFEPMPEIDRRIAKIRGG